MTQLSFLCKENEHTTIENGNERALRVEVIILTKNVFAGHRSINERERAAIASDLWTRSWVTAALIRRLSINCHLMDSLSSRFESDFYLYLRERARTVSARYVTCVSSLSRCRLIQ